MLILSLRTDRPEAEIGLYNNGQQISYETWSAHRILAETIHTKIQQVLQSQHLQLADIAGLLVFKGPGSFTGLRIGLTVANSLTYALHIPIVSTQGDNWLTAGLERLQAGANETIAMPEYGAEPNITTPKH